MCLGTPLSGIHAPIRRMCHRAAQGSIDKSNPVELVSHFVVMFCEVAATLPFKYVLQLMPTDPKRQRLAPPRNHTPSHERRESQSHVPGYPSIAPIIVEFEKRKFSGTPYQSSEGGSYHFPVNGQSRLLKQTANPISAFVGKTQFCLFTSQ